MKLFLQFLFKKISNYIQIDKKNEFITLKINSIVFIN